MSLVHNALMAGLLALALPVPVAAAADPLAPHRWTSRLLVVIAPGRDDAAYREQVRLFERAQAGSRERDLVVVEGIGDSADARALRRRFGVPDEAFRAILVGKDGGAKLSAAQPISSEQLFDTIDAMPMRRSEMQGRRS
jgi:hypothetical protein